MLPVETFNVRPSVTTTDAGQAAAVAELVRWYARDEQDHALLLAVLGLEES